MADWHRQIMVAVVSSAPAAAVNPSRLRPCAASSARSGD